MKKYILVGKKNKILESRNKLDSLRLNYTFGDDKIDKNPALRAFMTRNMDKRSFKRIPLDHELQILSNMIKEVQQDNIIKDNFDNIENE